MGGHKGGARASSLALEVLKQSVESSVEKLRAAEGTRESASDHRTGSASLSPATTTMRLAALKAGREVFRAASLAPALHGMGTTLTAMDCDAGRMHLVHAGDSRAYLFREGRIRQLTDDHWWVAEQIRNGLMTE